MKWPICLATLVGAATPSAGAQTTLEQAADWARSAWLAQDAAAMAALGDTLLLRLPGGSEGSVVASGQAARLLGLYLKPAAERGFDLRSVRATADARGYAEAVRRYVVRGTSDELAETVLLGFRQAGVRWRLTEIRVMP